MIVVVVVVGGLGLLHSGLFSAKKVVVTGNHPHISTATILAAAGLAGHPPLISVNTGVVAARVERLPWIATARVSRNWPDHITIAVTERVPVASMAGPGTSWSEVDRTGRTVQVDAARVPALVDVAVRDAKGGVPPAPLGSITDTADLPALRVARTLPAAFVGQVTQVIGNADGTVDLALNFGSHRAAGHGQGPPRQVRGRCRHHRRGPAAWGQDHRRDRSAVTDGELIVTGQRADFWPERRDVA